jgi:hypothetical protein
MISSVMELRPINPLALWAMLICLLPWSEAGGQAQNRAASSKATVTPPPMPAQAGSPIDFFRQLITAKPEEREKLLMRKAPDSPELRKKLEEHALRYQNELSAEERELRLRNMELRYHLTSLLYTAPSNRMERLKFVPDRDRPLVEDRLKYWDSLPAEQQKEVLKNERLTREIVGAGFPRRPANPTSLTGQTSNQVVRIEQQLVEWQMLPDARRAKVQQYFTNNIFELTDEEKTREKLLQAQLSEEERQLMERTLARFKQLSPSQRSACVQSFSKLASLSPAERREFLVSAGEWQKMKSEDREAWRKLVSKVPPLPPLPQSHRPPPLPTVVRPTRTGSPTTVQSTN